MKSDERPHTGRQLRRTPHKAATAVRRHSLPVFPYRQNRDYDFSLFYFDWFLAPIFEAIG